MTNPTHNTPTTQQVAIIGGGPAGLMAAEVLSSAGVQVNVYDAMPSVGRKLLMAGRSGLNLTHGEDYARFVTRYGERQAELRAMLDDFTPEALRSWVQGLGIDTYVGNSGRVFPVQMKAAPLLRAWLGRLTSAGVTFHLRHRWLGWHTDNRLRFATPEGEKHIKADAVLLALGGGSWARLGSDGQWLTTLQQAGIDVAPLRPANCGFDVSWSEHFRSRYAGEPMKNISLSLTDVNGQHWQQQGEFVISKYGVEGSLIYALSAPLRDLIEQGKPATLYMDLTPDKSLAQLTTALSKPRNKASLSNHLRKRIHIEGVKTALLHELLSKDTLNDPAQLAAAIKALPLTLNTPRPLDEAISTAGGVRFNMLDQHLMLATKPGTFCAGEMLDWEAPTGGYLLTACLATGRAAGKGILNWLAKQNTNK